MFTNTKECRNMKKVIKLEQETYELKQARKELTLEGSNKETEKREKKKNAQKARIIIIVTIALLLVGILAVVYNANKDFRNFMDKYILRKNVTEENLPTIEIDYNSNTNIIPYGKYICILAENTLSQYNASGKKENEVKIEIGNPIYAVEGKYLVIGEKDNQKLYLVTGEHIVWEKNIEGNLAKVSVNKNGYVSAIVTGTTHKSVIITYDAKGNELFKSYLASTIAVDSAISPDNSELAYAEVNTTGTAVQSSIKIISIDAVKEKNTEAKYTYTAPQNNLIMRIQYQDKNALVAMYEDGIHLFQNGTDTEILKLVEEGKKITFADIKLNNHVFRTVEKSTGLFQADTIIEIKNINTQKENMYTAEEVVKSVESYKNIIAINLGTEVEFIDTNGWLAKRYTSTQVIRNIVIGDGLAGVIYRDKIELINL